MKKAEAGAATVKEARALLGGLAPESFYKLVNGGELRTFKIGSKRYVAHKAINDFIARREQAEAERRAGEPSASNTSTRS